MMKECEKEIKESEFEDYSLQTTLFTAAGTVLLMACLKCAGMVFLFEQWRGWVFFILNLVLFAVVFMSINPASSSGNSNSDDGNIVQQMKVEETKQRRNDSKLSQVIESIECYIKAESCSTNVNNGGIQSDIEDKEHEEEEEQELSQLSKEELNERVEAFITMFRRQLVSDAKASEYCKRHNFNSSHQHGIKCVTVKV